MPSPAKKTRLCVFGDSHIGAVKRALNDGLFDPGTSLEIEFWGADGPRFRMLDLIDGRIVPREGIEETIRTINGQGREVLDPADFDAVLFTAVRIRAVELFQPMLERSHRPDGYLSRAVFDQTCADWLRKNKYYRMAQAFAETDCHVLMSIASFPSERMMSQDGKDYSAIETADPAISDRIWNALVTAALDDDITLIPQPADTITANCFSRAEYDMAGAEEAEDFVHRGPLYGAMLLAAAAAELAA